MIRATGRASICNDWEYTDEWSEAFLAGEGEAGNVRLPHNVGKLPLHYADPSDYSRICGYRKRIAVPKEAEGKRIFLIFEGAAHIATVYVNGTEVASHSCGYTAFRAEITEAVRFGGENLIAVKLDTTENPAVPPFGFVIDYLTYGGLYREAWYEERSASYIEDIFITTPKFRRVKAEYKVNGPFDGVRFLVKNDAGGVLAEAEEYFSHRAGGNAGNGGERQESETNVIEFTVPGALLWDLDQPNVYTLRAELICGGEAVDAVEDTFGFRQVKWRANGFYLNGRKVFLHGLNRHQSYPYLGYAAPAGLQAEDARILKEELGCNAVRTSHYPQSRHFLDACDRLGLLVFTEIPGWQHIGDLAWQDQAVENVREMILEDRNHPSVFLWGVRINESVDSDDFYRRTNALAHALDPTRATSGVRFIENSSLLEDVYAYNDFSHNGTNPGAKPKKAVMRETDRPLFISECNGHMYPTKPFDPWGKRQEHALRHARVLEAAMADGEHTGCFEWCMFDYQTHKDFGSGDRVCYHGVLDLFRNPKLAAAVHRSQSDAKPVLEISSPMDIGDYSASRLGGIWAFTNADEVRLYKNDRLVRSYYPDPESALAHPPILIDDMIGDLLETQEGFAPAEAKLVRECLLAAGEYGMPNLPAKDKAKLLWCMARYGLTMKDGTDLYGKYVGNWGGEATVWRFDGIKDGKVVSTVIKTPSSALSIEAAADRTALCDGDTWDCAAVRIRILDGNGAVAPYAQIPLTLETTGPVAVEGPSVITAEGGMTGTYLRTLAKEAGAASAKEEASLTVSADGLAPVTIRFTVERN